MPNQLPGYDLWKLADRNCSYGKPPDDGDRADDWKLRSPYDVCCKNCMSMTYCRVDSPLDCPLHDWTKEVINDIAGDRAAA